MPNKQGSLEQADAIQMATDIAAAYVSNNKLATDQIPNLIYEIYGAITALAEDDLSLVATREPAVPINKSVAPDYIVCLEDGKKLTMLKRYLRTHYDLTPEEYRRRWNLPADYPMVAPNYAKKRSKLAKDIGLGTAATTKRKTTKRKTTTKRATKKR